MIKSNAREFYEKSEATEQYDGCIIIHCEHLSEEKRIEIAHAISEFLSENYPNEIKLFS